jgi:hypothetical protein
MKINFRNNKKTEFFPPSFIPSHSLQISIVSWHKIHFIIKFNHKSSRISFPTPSFSARAPEKVIIMGIALNDGKAEQITLNTPTQVVMKLKRK